MDRLKKAGFASLLAILALGSVPVFGEAIAVVAEQTLDRQAITEEEQNLKATAEAADQWLKLMDEGKYGESWDAGSNIFRFTIKRDEWID
jgi:cell division protein FtsL